MTGQILPPFAVYDPNLQGGGGGGGGGSGAILGGGRVETIVYEDATSHTPAAGYRAITLYEDISAITNADIEFEFKGDGATGSVLSFRVSLVEFLELPIVATPRTGNSSSSDSSLQFKSTRGDNDSAINAFSHTNLFIIRYAGDEIAYSFTSNRSIGNHLCSIRIIQYPNVFTFQSIPFATNYNAIIPSDSIRLTQAEIETDGYDTRNNYVKILKYDAYTYYLDLHLGLPFNPGVEQLRRGSIVCEIPAIARPDVSAWFRILGFRFHISAAGELRIPLTFGDLPGQGGSTNYRVSGFAADIIPATWGIPPDPVSDVTFTTTQFTIVVSWVAPDYDGDSPLTHYNLYFYSIDRQVYEAPVEVPPEVVTFPHNYTTLPSGRYWVYMTAENAVGESGLNRNPTFGVLTVP